MVELLIIVRVEYRIRDRETTALDIRRPSTGWHAIFEKRINMFVVFVS